MRNRVVTALLLLALLGVGVLTARTPVPTSATRSTRDDSFGGYHAWYELEEREGVRVTRFRRRHDALDAEPIDTLILAFPANAGDATWTRDDVRAVDAWITRGGDAVFVGGAPRTPHLNGEGRRLVLRAAHGPAGALRGPWSASVCRLRDHGRFRIPADEAVSIHATTLLADGAGALVVRYRTRGGIVTIAANAMPFENRAIGNDDAARLAFLLAQPRRAAGLVAFDEAIRGEIVDRPWYQALDAAEKLALALAALAGLLWLLRGIVPLGPPVHLRAPREPTSAEFLGAYAALYARAAARDRARDALVAGARRALERRPAAERAADGERLDAAAQHAVSDDGTLVAVARLAHTIREDTARAQHPDRHRAAPAGGTGTRRRRR